MKKAILTISLLFILMGCASTPLLKPSKASRIQFIESNSIVNPEIENAIINGEVIEGMTAEQVRAAWGEPDSISNKNSENCMNCSKWFEDGEEVWEYKWDLIGTNKIVKFKNGVVVRVEYDYT